jgi:methenyltetrahydrofolate cyclohydrolase
LLDDLLKEGMDGFISEVAAAVPLPGGGSVAALAGTLAAALGEMMAGLTEGRETFASVQSQVTDIHAKLAVCRDALRTLVQEDAAAYQTLMNATRLPRESEEQRTVRASAIEKAVRGATETPLRTARAAFEVLECLNNLIELGNPNAKSDVAVGAQLAYASLKGAQYNILTNIRVLKDAPFAENCRIEITGLLRRGQESLRHIDALITGN